MPVVSNTSPLFNLAAIGKLSLLRQAFDEILIPEAVLHELEPVREYPGVQAIHEAIAENWIAAKREGHLESVKEMMIALRDEVGFYIRRDLFAKILHLAGEG
jgi:predicted nucleic acid-binding protein